MKRDLGSPHLLCHMGLLVLLVPLGSACAPRGEPKNPPSERSAIEEAAAECSPGWVSLGERIEVGAGNWRLYATPLIVGCSHRLETLTDDQKKRLRSHMVEVVSAAGIGLRDHRLEEEFRRGTTAELNRIVGRHVVDDVVFADFNAIEYRLQSAPRQ